MEGLRTDYQKLLKCTHCLKGFQDPILLPCLHSFCKECITGSGGYIPKCPTCDDAFTEDDVKDDVKVQSMIKLRDEHSPSVTLDYAMEYAPSAGMKVKQLAEAHGLYWMVMENGELMAYNDQTEQEMLVKYPISRFLVHDLEQLWWFSVFVVGFLSIISAIVFVVNGYGWIAVLIAIILTPVGIKSLLWYKNEKKAESIALVVTEQGRLLVICTTFRRVCFVTITPKEGHDDVMEVDLVECATACNLQYITCSSVSDLSRHGGDIATVTTSEASCKAWRIYGHLDALEIRTIQTPYLLNPHKVDIKICSDEKSIYSISHNMIYRYKWNKGKHSAQYYEADIESTYVFPIQLDGDALNIHGATKGRILISHNVTNALNQQIYRQLYILNIASSTWTLLRIPDENCILVYAKLDAQKGVYAFCRKAGGTGLRLFRLQIEDLDGKRAPQQEEPVEEAQGGGEQTTGPITMNFNTKILAFGEETCRQYMPDNPSMMAAIQDGSQQVTSQDHMFPSFEDQQSSVVRRATITEFKEE